MSDDGFTFPKFDKIADALTGRVVCANCGQEISDNFALDCGNEEAEMYWHASVCEERPNEERKQVVQ